MAEEQKYVRVRVSGAADFKLSEIARARHLTKTEALSRIILSSVVDCAGREAAFPEGMKTIMDKLSGIHILVAKNAGAAERTESFIKGLLRETRGLSGGEQDAGAPGTTGSIEQTDEDAQSPQALLLLGRLLALGIKGVNFDGTPVMQIKLSMEEYLRVQTQYEQLCTSQNT